MRTTVDDQTVPLGPNRSIATGLRQRLHRGG
jgi:hypothetical protein